MNNQREDVGFRDPGGAKLPRASSLSDRNPVYSKRDALPSQSQSLIETRKDPPAMLEDLPVNGRGVHFRTDRTMRCFDQFEEFGMEQISNEQCIEYCLQHSECEVFSQYDSGNGMLSGCFLFSDASKCRRIVASSWISSFKGLTSEFVDVYNS